MADIVWGDIVGSLIVGDGGYVGDLLALARDHIDDAVSNNELTVEQAGEIFTAMIPAAFQNAIHFGMNEQLLEAQIDSAVSAAASAGVKSKLDLAELIAKLDKEYGYDWSVDANGDIDIANMTDAKDGILDKQSEKLSEELKAMEYNTEAVNTKNLVELIAQFGYTSASIDATTKEITLGTRGTTGTITKQERLFDEQIINAANEGVAITSGMMNGAAKLLEEAVVQFGYTAATVNIDTGIIDLGVRTTDGLLDRDMTIKETQVKLSKTQSGRS